MEVEGKERKEGEEKERERTERDQAIGPVLLFSFSPFFSSFFFGIIYFLSRELAIDRVAPFHLPT